MNTKTRLIEGLRNPAAYDHAVIRIEIIETHISWIVLTGDYAYKIKKPVSLGFLDFSTLDARAYYCAEELRLNRRLAPNIYLDVIPIGGTDKNPRVGITPAIEYALKMRQFDPHALALDALQSDILTDVHWCRLAKSLAQFHATAAVIPPSLEHGTSETIQQQSTDNFEALIANIPSDLEGVLYLKPLETWSCLQIASLSEFWELRRNNGFIRECHGDLHLGNIALLGNELVPFDALEFNESLRMIDVISDLAFLIMDLDYQHAHRTAFLLRNEYLDHTADFEGVRALRFYLVYRALVRAKVAAIRLHQVPHSITSNTTPLVEDIARHLALARQYSQPPSPIVLITNGLSGSGKSTLAREIAARKGAIWLRSDTLRKRLTGIDRNEQSGVAVQQGRYSELATAALYAKMCELADHLLDQGQSVLVDATFLLRRQRADFINIANKRGLKFYILHCHTDTMVLRQRIEQRALQGRDPSEATQDVLGYQLEIQEPLSPDEIPFTITIDTHAPIDLSSIERQIV